MNDIIKALEAAEYTLRKIAKENEKVAKITLDFYKEQMEITNWPGGIFEGIAEACLGRASIIKSVISDIKDNSQ